MLIISSPISLSVYYGYGLQSGPPSLSRFAWRRMRLCWLEGFRWCNLRSRLRGEGGRGGFRWARWVVGIVALSDISPDTPLILWLEHPYWWLWNFSIFFQLNQNAMLFISTSLPKVFSEVFLNSTHIFKYSQPSRMFFSILGSIILDTFIFEMELCCHDPVLNFLWWYKGFKLSNKIQEKTCKKK